MDDFWNMFFLLQLEKLIWQRKRIRAELELEKQKDTKRYQIPNHNNYFQNELSPTNLAFENLECEKTEDEESSDDESVNNTQKNLTMRIYKKSDLMPKNSYTLCRLPQLFSNDEIINKIKIEPYVKDVDNPITKQKYKYRLNEMCEVCGIIVRRKNMDYHMNTHLKLKPFVCNYKNCRKSFASRSTLYNHRRLHTTIKNFKCDICSATFHFNGGLQKHKATHFEAKFKCKVCNRKYKTLYNLKYHMNTHNVTEEAFCTFPSCNRKFKNASCVAEHLRRFHKIKAKERVSRPST